MTGPAELFERQPELGERAAIEVARGEELVARLHHGEEGEESGRMAGRRGAGGAPAFEGGQALLEHGHGGIADARIDVAEVVQVEERGRIVDVVEHIGRRLEDRRDACAGGGVGRRAGMDRLGLEAVDGIGGGPSRRRCRARALRRRLGLGDLGRRLRRLVADDARVDAAPGKLAAQAAEFDLGAAVHHHLEAGRLGLGGGLVMADAELHPHHLRADGDGIVDDRRHRLGIAEHVDHVDLVGNIAQAGVGRLAQQLLAGESRVHRDDAIALRLQVLHHEVAGPVPVGRDADDGDGLHRAKDADQLGVGIVEGSEVCHGESSSVFAPNRHREERQRRSDPELRKTWIASLRSQ